MSPSGNIKTASGRLGGRRGRPRQGKRDSREVAALAARRAVSAEHRTIRAVIVVLTFLAIVALLVFSLPALNLEVGERVRRDYVARVGFDVLDTETANYEREAARRSQPTCYSVDQQALRELREQTLALFRRVRLPGDIDAIVSAMASERGINLLEPKQFRRELAQMGSGLAGLVEQFFARAARNGILGAEKFKDEISQGHEEIAIIQGEDALPVRTKLSDVLTLGDGGESLERHVEQVFAKQSDIFRSNARSIIARCIETSDPVLRYDAEATDRLREEAAAKIVARTKHIEAGEVILRRGQTVRNHHLYELRAERQAYWRAALWSKAQLQVLAGTALPLALVFLGFATYVSRFQSMLVRSNSKLLMLCLLCTGVLAIGHLLVRWGGPVLLTPVALASIIVALCHGERFAVLVSIFLGVALAIVQGGGAAPAIALGLGGAAAALCSVRIDRRATMIKIGLVTGAVQFVSVWAVQLAQMGFPGEVTALWLRGVGIESGWALFNGVAVGLLASSVLPVIEYLFDITTDITLLELSDLNQPALRELMLAAPGTYHHSLMVGMLSEDAAKAVGANPLLARVGSYYHDIGKMSKPEYFVENVASGVSQHTDLAPTMSALVITAHTKDGCELADEYRLPARIRDIVAQHHGTTRVEYFYREALKESGEENVEEDAFRYRGPKPQSKEAAIVMLADSVESASRVLSEPNPSRLEGLIDEIIDRKLRDGQLDECQMTFRELKQVRDSLARSLIGTFHSRIKYPEPEKPEGS